MKIAIDIGHNCDFDSGARGIKLEDDCTKEIGNLVITKLIKLGHTVVPVLPLSAVSLENSLEQRALKANKEKVDVFVSIHLNAYNKQAKGTEVYHYPGSSKGKQYAVNVLQELVKLGFANRGIKEAKYMVLKLSSAPAILVECCFIDNAEDMKIYNAEKIASAIVKGITGQEPINNSINKLYKVQVGAYKERVNAENMLKELEKKGFKGYIKEE